MAARKSAITDDVGARVAGVDAAGDSDNADRTVISVRQGRRIEKRIKFSRMRPMELAGIIAKLIVDERLDMVFIDRGYGEGTIDRLYEMGYAKQVVGVAFNEKTLFPDLYSNKRTEMFMEYAKWLNGGDVRIPDDDEGHAALAVIPPAKRESTGVHSMPSKDSIKKLPGAAMLMDLVDADILTFAYQVRGAATGGARPVRRAGGTGGVTRNGGPLKSSALRRRGS